MSVQPRRRYTLQEYLALEASSEEKYEYFDGEVFAMSGASLVHERIVANLITALKNRLRGRPCDVYPSNARIKVPGRPPYRYADIAALCGKTRSETIDGIEMLLNPALIVEVLSPSTEAYDRGDKFTHYKSVESFAEYLLIAQHRPHATHYVKTPDGAWRYEEINGVDAAVRIETLDCDLPLKDIYEGAEFPTDELPPLGRP